MASKMKLNSSSSLSGLIVASASICFLFTLVMTLYNDDVLISFGASFLLATFYFLFASNKETTGNLFHPYSYFILSGGLLSFGLPVLLVAINPFSFSSLRMSTENLAIVSFLITASFIIYVAGYRLPIGKNLARMVPLFGFPKRPPRRQYIFTAYVLYGIGWLARTTAWGLGHHHKNPDLGEAITLVSSVLSPLSIFATLSFVVLLSDYFSRAKEGRVINPFGVFVMALIFLEVLAGMADGSRTKMILPLLYVGFVYNYAFKPVKWRHVIAGIVILVTILAPATTVYRKAYYEVLDIGGASLVGASATFSKVSGDGAEMQYENIIDSVTGRFSSLLEGALVVYDKVPRQIDYAEGGTFFPSAFLNFIPRLLWADKPMFNPGRIFAQVFWGVGIGELYATNMGIGWIGESYYNFGWFGLGIPLVLGVILRFFVVRLDAYSRIEVTLMPRLYFVLFLVTAIGSFHYYPSGLLRSTIFCLVYLSILNHGFPRMIRFRGNTFHRRLTDHPRLSQGVIR